jgi:hypothetical protein
MRSVAVILAIGIVSLEACAGGTTSPTIAVKTAPTSPPSGSNPFFPKQIVLDEPATIVIDTTLGTSCDYCGAGDTNPCGWFVVDVPRAGMLAVRIESEPDYPISVGFGAPLLEQDVASGPPPLTAREAVEPGLVRFTAGAENRGNYAGPSRLQLRVIATLE